MVRNMAPDIHIKRSGFVLLDERDGVVNDMCVAAAWTLTVVLFVVVADRITAVRPRLFIRSDVPLAKMPRYSLCFFSFILSPVTRLAKPPLAGYVGYVAGNLLVMKPVRLHGQQVTPVE